LEVVVIVNEHGLGILRINAPQEIHIDGECTIFTWDMHMEGIILAIASDEERTIATIFILREEEDDAILKLLLVEVQDLLYLLGTDQSPKVKDDILHAVDIQMHPILQEIGTIFYLVLIGEGELPILDKDMHIPLRAIAKEGDISIPLSAHIIGFLNLISQIM
jgi:hypothetical protein